MKKEKSFSLMTLVKLYSSFLFQKTTIIIFSIALVLILGIIIYLSNPFMNVNDYLVGYKEIHLNFFLQSFFVLQLFNSVIIATISISLIIQAQSFDTLFLSHTSRWKLCISKIITSSIVLFLLVAYEILLIIIIPLIRFPLFNINKDIIFSLFYLFLSTLTESIISFLVSIIIPVVFSPMLFMFISVVIKLLCNNFTNFKNIFTKIIPFVDVSYDGIKFDAFMLTPIWILLFGMLFLSIYSIKDLK